MQVLVTAGTTMSAEQKQRVVERVEAIEPLAASPVLGARVRVTRADNPAVAHAYRAEGEIDVNGRLVRAHGRGPSADAAFDALTDRLERQVLRLAERRTTKRRESGEVEPGTWRHGTLPSERFEFFPRPHEEREVLRRKTFALEPMTPLQAAADMVDLDHDFYLFQEASTGEDAVIHRLREDGRLGLIAPAAAVSAGDEQWMAIEPNRFSEAVAVDTAVDEMNAVNHRFLYFVDRDNERGAVIYRRYDGHYGLIEAR